MTCPVFGSFGDAYRTVLAHVSEHAEHVTSSRGNRARECLNVGFTLADPRQRIVYAPARRANIVFCFAEALWYLLGRDDLAMIGFYAPRLRTLASDHGRLTGTAYGPRLFGQVARELSRWQRACTLPETDPDSKRTVLGIFDPRELADPANPDVSCTLAVHLLRRAGRLHAITYMRANDAVTGLLCDVFSFTLIQEFTARQLGLQLGSYTHHAGSMHINDPDASRARRIITEPAVRQPPFPALTMPPTTPEDLRCIGRFEEALRRDQQRLRPADLSRTGLHPYWQQVLLLFETYRQISYEHGAVSPETLLALKPGYRWLVMHRWPDAIPASIPKDAP